MIWVDVAWTMMATASLFTQIDQRWALLGSVGWQQ